MSVQGDFTVTMTANHVVAAAVPLQDHRLPLSNLDLLLPPLDVNVFLCYRNSSLDLHDEEVQKNNIDNTFIIQVSLLKKSLAQALAYFYLFAGEVVENLAGEPEILCNNRGVEFVEASADVDLNDLNLYNPDQCIEGKLVPKTKKEAVFSVQVSELKCGGIVVGCAFDHRVADAYSANMFLVTWAELATFKPISTTPSFRRDLLGPKDNAFVNNYGSYFDEMYLPLSNLKPPQNVVPLVSRLYLITKDQLDNIQSLCGELESGGCKRKYSKLQSLCTFLWQIIASHACQLGVENINKVTKMGIVVDGRRILSIGESNEVAQAFASYFGNVLCISSGEQTCGNLKEIPISVLAKIVHDFLENSMTRDHFFGLFEWVKTKRPQTMVAKIYCANEEDGPTIMVSSGLRFPVSKMDFGWGKPTFGSYHFSYGGSCGFVMPMPTPSQNGDWIVYMHLSKEQLDYIEVEASHVFQPFSLGIYIYNHILYDFN